MRPGRAQPFHLDLQDGDLVDQLAPGDRGARKALCRLMTTRRHCRARPPCARTRLPSRRAVVWRNRRMVGYQRQSSPSSSQRQSGTCCRPTQTGRPSAPARCATDVSDVMTRSRHCITAAVSMNASGPASKSSPSVSIRSPSGSAGKLLQPVMLLQADQPHARHLRQGQELLQRDRAAAFGGAGGIALPGDADPPAMRARSGRATLRPDRGRRSDRGRRRLSCPTAAAG